MEFDERQLNLIDMGKRQNLDISWYANDKFNAEQMNEILKGLEHDVDVSSFAKPEYSAREMRIKRSALDGTANHNYDLYPRAVRYIKQKFGKEYLDRFIGDEDYLDAIEVALTYMADVKYVENPYLSSEKREKFRWYIFNNESDEGIESVCEFNLKLDDNQKKILYKLWDKAKKYPNNLWFLNLIKDELTYEQLALLLQASSIVDDIAPYANPDYSCNLLDLLLFRVEDYRIEDEADLNPRIVYNNVVKDIFGSGILRRIEYDYSFYRLWCMEYERYTGRNLNLNSLDDNQVKEIWRDLYLNKPAVKSTIKTMNLV